MEPSRSRSLNPGNHKFRRLTLTKILFKSFYSSTVNAQSKLDPFSPCRCSKQTPPAPRVLGTTLKGLTTRRRYRDAFGLYDTIPSSRDDLHDYLNTVAARPSQGRRISYDCFDSTRTQPPKWLDVLHTHTSCDIGPSLQPGLLYTYPGLSTRPTTNDALLSRGWY